jgi:hypothetical protein
VSEIVLAGKSTYVTHAELETIRQIRSGEAVVK